MHQSLHYPSTCKPGDFETYDGRNWVLPPGVEESFLDVTQGRVALLQTFGPGVPLLFLHGNSSCKEIFLRQLRCPLAERHRCIALDLPGHGGSDDARDVSSYTFSGYAETVVEVLEALDIDHVVLVGWSMGGHIALEVMTVFPGVTGVFLMGTPPVDPGLRGLMQGFKLSALMHLSNGNNLSQAQAARLVAVTVGEAAPPELIGEARRSDGRARRALVRHILRGHNASEIEIIETQKAPIAVVNGRSDPIVDLARMPKLRWNNLWRACCFEVTGGHAAFLDVNHELDELLAAFAGDMEDRASAQRQEPALCLGG